MDEPILNSHNKAEYEPAHTAEHILNRTMVNMFGCPRSRNAHIEKKKSKCDYLLSECPTDDQVKAIEARGVAHVRSYAGAVIVIAHSDDAQCFRRIVRQFAQVHD